MKKLILLFIIIASVFSCKKDKSEPENPSLSEITVNESFTWETTNLLNFTILMPLSGAVKITSEDGQIIFYKGFNNRLIEEFLVSVRIPTHLKKVIVNGVLVEITGNEITVDFNTPNSLALKSGKTNRGLVSSWPMNENSGTILNDQTGSNHGSIIGANWQTGIEGSALEFNGISGVVLIPNAQNLNISQQVTLTAWAKAYENKEAKVAQKGDWDGFNLGLGKWKGWKASIYGDDNVAYQIEWNQGIPLMNEWYFLAMTYDGAFFKFYVNGHLKGELPLTVPMNINNRDFCIGSDNNAQKFFNGVIDEVRLYDNALSELEISNLYNLMPNNDSDGDGVPDDDDDYPFDPERAFNNFYPAAGYGSLAFEDLWPNQGDYDFNDLVLDYQFTTVTNANNYIAEIEAQFVIKAIGAGYKNGFGFQFNQNFPADHIQVTGYELTENYITLSSNGTESNQEKTTLIIFDNASKHLEFHGGIGVNVDHDYPFSEPDTIETIINFIDDTYTSSEILVENWNPFLIVNKNRSVEVHLSNHLPTSFADLTLLGTSDDHSIPDQGVYYKTINNLPWAIELPVSFDYPMEKTVISDAHLKFVDWALSSGSNFTDWYLNLPGYREVTKIY